MREDLIQVRQALPNLLPGAIAWAEACVKKTAEAGEALSTGESEIARRVGVRRPELVRVQMVTGLPAPEDAALRAAALACGLLDPRMAGLTLGHTIFIRRGHKTRRLLSHELRHVHQYEAHGSIAAFLSVYLKQIVELGYRDAPLETDAAAHEMCDP
jgi:hypothetical protein